MKVKVRAGGLKTWTAPFLFIILIFPPSKVFAAEILEKLTEDVRLGVGAGVHYGFFGANVEAGLSDYVSLSGGLGSRHGKVGWVVGTRAYPFKRDRRFSPRLSAFYGTVRLLHVTFIGVGDSYITSRGGTVGAGFDLKFYERTSFDLDLSYAFVEPQQGFPRR
jgi:hypothetical protein